MRSSAPKFVRKKTGWPKMRSLRTSQGVTSTRKISEASSTPARERRPARHRRDHPQKPNPGRKHKGEGRVIPPTPHSKPTPPPTLPPTPPPPPTSTPPHH